jgi:hypothetical protein
VLHLLDFPSVSNIANPDHFRYFEMSINQPDTFKKDEVRRKRSPTQENVGLPIVWLTTCNIRKWEIPFW